jgi:PAS domain S-box-containing protein
MRLSIVRVYTVIFLLILISNIAIAKSVRVGIYQNSPKVFLNDEGKPQGIFIDIIEEIARNEQWELQYVFGTWTDNLKYLDNSEIDILLDVSYSHERAERFTLSKIFVIDDWLEVFTLKELPIKSVFDLEGKRVSVVESSIQHDYMQHDVKELFNLNYILIAYSDYPTAIQSLKNGNTDVFVASRFFYFSDLRDKDVWPTSIILRPAEVYFAFPKNGDKDLMAAIDRNMIKMKNNPRSVYYRSINNWLGVYSKYTIPDYLKWLLAIAIALLFVLILFTYLLRLRVKAKTNDLTEKNQELEALNNQLQALLLEHKLSQDELMKFQFMVENARQEVYLITFKGKLVYVNKAVGNSLGYTYQEMINGGVNLFDPSYGSTYHEHFSTLKKQELPAFETNHFTKDGRKLIKKVKTFYLRIGNQEYICGFAEDITELKKAEKALLDSQQLFKTLAQMAPVGIFRTRADGYTTYVNPRWCEISGISFVQALGDGWINAVHPDDRDLVINNWKVLSGQGVKSEAEYRFLKPNGDITWVLGDAIPNIVDGEISEYIGTITDITERKNVELLLKEKADEIEAQNEEYRRLNIELQKAKLKAEESDRLKTSFLANMSHEIRTPMNAICGFSKLLSHYNVDDQKRDSYIDIINSNAQQLLGIINDIVDISKIESGLITLTQSKFSINIMLDDLMNTFAIVLDSKKIDLFCKKGLPDNSCQIVSDEIKLQQIITNLLSNSVKFTQKGYIEYGYELAGNNLVFFVRDTGIGIPSDAIDIIFERFRQVEDATMDSRKGTGLGLPISKAYVELLGGKMWVESEEGKGSTFSFTIPYSSTNREQQVSENFSNKTYSLTNKTILIAEDDEHNLYFLSEILNEIGANIISVTNGVDAVEICKQNDSIDIVLMDIKLPKINGLDATKEIKKFRKKLPIIAQTAYAFSVDADRAIESGCDAYLSKPIDSAELIKTIAKFIG